MNDGQYIAFVLIALFAGVGLITAGLMALGKKISDVIKEWKR
jgi:hypothetical protein